MAYRLYAAVLAGLVLTAPAVSAQSQERCYGVAKAGANDGIGRDETPGGSTRDYCQPANYQAPAPDVYYRNVSEPDGVRFADATAAAGFSVAYGNGLGVAVGDFDGDAVPDLYVTNDGDPNQLWLAQGDGTFRERALY